uniref:Phosphonate ABC transporter, inner membrane subunit n=2 Tax=Pseudomonas putida TaxID=303 RepID=A5VYQ4_PSEP1
MGYDARLAQPAVPQRCTGGAPGLGRARPGRQAVRAVWAVVRWPVAAGGHCSGVVPASAGAADRRTGVGHGPGVGRPQPGRAQSPCPGRWRDVGGEPARRRVGAGAFSAGDRYSGRAGCVRLPGRSGHRATAGRAIRQRTTGSAANPGADPDRADSAMLKADARDPALLPRLLLALLAVAVLWPAIQTSELNPGVLLQADNRQQIASFTSAFWPPAHDADFLALLYEATLQTLAVATAGMALALLLAIPAGLLASRALSLRAASRGRRAGFWSRLLRLPVRGLLIFLRSVPEIVWALLFVRAVGLGPTAGVLAIAITYSGMLGKVYAEIFESVDQRPAHALLQAGSGRLAAFFYGILPNAASEVVSYTVYRWECAVRASVVMGFVGAGGLGQQIDLSMRMFAGAQVASMLLTFLLLVILADLLSRLLRWRLA